MDAFKQFTRERDFGAYSKEALADASFRAGMRAAAELCHGVVARGDIVPMEITAQRIKDAILAEADK